MQVNSGVGISFPLHCTANGKVFLSSMPDEKIKMLLSEPLKALTPNTILSMDQLLKELEQVRQNGIAYDREENDLGICAVGGIIHSTTGHIAAVTIPVPAQRFYLNEDKLVHALKKTCDLINSTFAPVK
ncbi:IclR family transcriptional regulator C-terminal domain-containing protein [Metabacillus sp. Hm71]|uniref:IclR family transcriptional regulator C-terminal domain-containing protein n=1 Tax=Metabacillus sp. Hm71 TaxID=3450743 RepID=UPI003F43B46F